MTNFEQRDQHVHTQYNAHHINIFDSLLRVFRHDERLRQGLLSQVQQTWIADYLERSLDTGNLIGLRLQEQPDAVSDPWHSTVQELKRSPQFFPEGTQIIQVYDEANGTLLILGEPGSGKTILLLDLARNLLQHAKQDETYPVPIVLPLFGWALRKQSLAKWVTQQLSQRYKIPRDVGSRWLKEGQLILLLDGLDEVAPEARTACVDAINGHIHDYGLKTPIVVCCRQTVYNDIRQWERQLQLQRAVAIQPLTHQQIQEYLSLALGDSQAINELLHANDHLQKLATTPLMVHILVRTYHNAATITPLTVASPESQWERLFATYVQLMLARRSTHPRYTSQETIRQLTWVAQQLKRHNLTEFHRSYIRSDWLPKGGRQLTYYIIMGLFFGSLPTGLGYTLFVRHLPPDLEQITQNSWQWLLQYLSYFAQWSARISGYSLLLVLPIVCMRLLYLLRQKVRQRLQSSLSLSEMTKAKGRFWPILMRFLKDCLLLIFPIIFSQMSLFAYFGGVIYPVAASDTRLMQQCEQLGGNVKSQYIPSSLDTGSVEYTCEPPAHSNKALSRKLQRVVPTLDFNDLVKGLVLGGEAGALIVVLLALPMAAIILLVYIPASLNAAHVYYRKWRVMLLPVLPCGVGGLLFVFMPSSVSEGIVWLMTILFFLLRSWHAMGVRMIVCCGIPLGCWVLFEGIFSSLSCLIVCRLLRFACLLPGEDFFHHAAERLLLRRVGSGYMFIHPLLLDYFANLDGSVVIPVGEPSSDELTS